MIPLLSTALSFSHLRSVNLARCEEGFKHPLKSWTPSQWLVAVGGEVGEALNVVKKITRVADGLGQFHDTDIDALRVKLAGEIADVVIYLDLLLARFDLSFDQAFIHGPESQVVPDVRYLRQLIWDRMGYASSLTDAAADMLSSAGKLAHEIICDTVDRESLDDPLFDEGMDLCEAAARLMGDLDTLAIAANIDLGAAVIETFNAKSAELGVTHKLEAC